MFGNAGRTQFDLKFEIRGISVRVHPLFWLIAAFITWIPQRLDLVLLGILCVFVSILVHELGHAVMTRRYGYRGEVVLYALGGYATTGRFSTWKSIAVSAAGPGAGFLLAGLVWLVRAWLEQHHPRFIDQGTALNGALRILWFVNFWWGMVNFVPCLPLDGGRIMQEIVSRYFPLRSRLRILWISILSSGAMAAWGLMNRHDYVLFLFGFICIQHIVVLKQRTTFR